jgi:sulfocyanin
MMRRLPPVLAIVCLLLGAMGLPALSRGYAAVEAAAPNPAWVHWDAGAKAATLTIIAAYNNVGGGFNFNGYNNGGLTITVPQGAKVTIAFTNKAPLPHSVVITPYAKRTLAGAFPPAFNGSASPNPMSGMANVAKPVLFSFTVTTAGTYALVCGVPGHALAGMWVTFVVAKVAAPSMSATGTVTTGGGQPAMPACAHGAPGTGAVAGTVTDASTGKPLPHTFVIVGWTTQMVAGETDAHGTYCVTGLKPAYVDAFGFAEDYVYYHGHPISIRAGKTVAYSFKMPRQTFAADLLPTMSGATITPTQVKPGDTATFSVHVKPGKGGPMSAEVFAVNGALGHSVLLTHGSGDLYSGTYQIPSGTKAGAYSFAFFGAMNNCLENQPYPTITLTVANG